MAPRKASVLAVLVLLLAGSCGGSDQATPRVPIEPLSLPSPAVDAGAASASAPEAEPAEAALAMFDALTNLDTEVMLELSQPESVTCTAQQLQELAIGLPPEPASAFVVDTAVEGNEGFVILDVAADGDQLQIAFTMQRSAGSWRVVADPCGFMETLATSHAQQSAREGLLMLQVFWTDNGQYGLTQQDIDSYQPPEPEFAVQVGPAHVDPFIAVVLPGSDHAMSYSTSTTGITYCAAIGSDGYIKWGAGALDAVDTYEECSAVGSTDFWPA